jgi:hypothetical protein
MSVVATMVNLMACELGRESHEMTPEEDVRCEHSAHIEEIDEVTTRIEWLMKDAMNAGLSATGPEVGVLRSIMDQYKIAAAMVAGRILEKKLAKLS